MQEQDRVGFTYFGYKKLLHSLANAGYVLVPFRGSNPEHESEVIVRHDVDLSLLKAERMAEVEFRAGVESTYFVMVSSEFYNAMSIENSRLIYEIVNLGHEIGLHFDIRKCQTVDARHIQIEVLREIDILSEIVGERIKCVSWHMPPAKFLGTDSEWLGMSNIKNAYSKEYFTEYKYYSDSMMRWRDPSVFDAKPEKYPKIQLLTHPVWYSQDGDVCKAELMRDVLLGRSAECVGYIDEICPGFIDQLR